MNKIINSAILGFGHIARNFHLPAIKKYKKFKIIAACEKNLKLNIKKFYSKKIYVYSKNMFQREIFNTVFIFTPPYLHLRNIIEAIKFKKNIFIEKPIVLSLKEFSILKKNIKKKKIFIQCALHQRFRPISIAIKKLINNNKIGKIYYINIIHRKFRAIPKQSLIFSNKKYSGGGPLIDLGTHYFDFVFWVLNFPKIKKITCNTFSNIFKSKKAKKYLPFKNFNNEESAIGSINLFNNTLVNFELSYVSNLSEEKIKIEFFGENGSAIWPENNYRVLNKNKLIKKKLKVNNRLASDLQIDDFYKNIINKKINKNIYQYEYIVKLIDQLYKSSKK